MAEEGRKRKKEEGQVEALEAPEEEERKERERKERKIMEPLTLFKEFSGLFKENFLLSLELTKSLWDENLNLMNSQLNQWLFLPQNYTKVMTEAIERFPKEPLSLWVAQSKMMNDQTERFFVLQREYFDSVRKGSDKVTREAIGLTQKGIERSFSLFDDYLSLLRG